MRVRTIEGPGFCREASGHRRPVDPPAHAGVLSLDEKSQIQAFDRTQPGRTVNVVPLECNARSKYKIPRIRPLADAPTQLEANPGRS